MVYNQLPYTVVRSSTFDLWMRNLRDSLAKAKVNARIRRLTLGNLGSYRNLAAGISELKVDHGPGYRVYYTVKKQTLVVLLCAGDKSSQANDIALARRIAAQWSEDDEETT